MGIMVRKLFIIKSQEYNVPTPIPCLCIFKKKYSQINNPNFHLKNTENEEYSIPQLSRKMK